MFLIGSKTNITLFSSFFYNCRASEFGAIIFSSNPELILINKCLFYGLESNISSGGFYIRKTIRPIVSSVIITDCEFINAFANRKEELP